MIKDYLIKERLGVGSFGTVYKVQKKSNNKIFVIKQIPLIGLNEKEIKKVNSEAKILSLVKSPYIVRYYESFEENNHLNIVMEYCDGGDLSEFIIKNKSTNILLKEDIIWNIFIKILIGLAELHKNKILHRDLKTMNIFLTKKLDIKIGDFGVAKILSQSNFANTIIGTPYYLSPELCEQLPYNDKSDVWALGCILYELCTYSHPFNAEFQTALLLKILQKQPKPINKYYSANLQKLINLLLDKNHETRPSCHDILNISYVIEKAKNFGLYDDIKNLYPENKVKYKLMNNFYRNKSYFSVRNNNNDNINNKNKSIYDKNTFQQKKTISINNNYNTNNIFRKNSVISYKKNCRVLYISKSNENLTKVPKEKSSQSIDKKEYNLYIKNNQNKRNYITKVIKLDNNNNINYNQNNNNKILLKEKKINLQIKPIKTNISNSIKNTIDEYEIKIKNQRKVNDIKKFPKDKKLNLNILNSENEEDLFKNIKTTDILENKEIDNIIQNKLLKMKKDKKEIDIKEFASFLNNNISKVNLTELNNSNHINNHKSKETKNKPKDKIIFNQINNSIDNNNNNKKDHFERVIIKNLFNSKRDNINNKFYKNVRINNSYDIEEKKSDSKIIQNNYSIENINYKNRKNKLILNKNIIYRINSAVYNKNKKEEKNRDIIGYSSKDKQKNYDYQV